MREIVYSQTLFGLLSVYYFNTDSGIYCIGIQPPYSLDIYIPSTALEAHRNNMLRRLIHNKSFYCQVYSFSRQENWSLSDLTKAARMVANFGQL